MKPYLLAITVALGWLVATAEPLAAQANQAKPAKRPMTVEDIWQVKRPGPPAISPDGSEVAVELTTWSMEKNQSSSEIWLLRSDGTATRQLTNSGGKNSGPVWSPDGKQIAFVSKRSGDIPQIYLIAPDGGEARQLSKLPTAPRALKWARSGKTIYCIGETWPDTPDDESHRKREQERKDAKVQAFVIDDGFYRLWDRWLADGKRPVVFAVDVATGEHRNLFAKQKLSLVPDADRAHYDIDPDGKELAFVAEAAKEPGKTFNHDIFTLDLDKLDAPARNLTADNPAADTAPVYSPDGKSLAFVRQTIPDFYADRARLMVLDRASGKSVELTGSVDRSFGPPVWSPDSRQLHAEVEDRGYVRLAAVRVAKGEVSYRSEGHTDRALALNRDGTRGAFLRASFDRPATVCTIEGDGRIKQLDTFNESLIKLWDLGKVEDTTFKGAEDHDVQMFVIYPPGFDPKKRWPLLQMVHGGPYNAITSDFSFRWNMHLLASKGYVVAVVNFHGSSGFGQAFCDSIKGELGVKPMIDVMKATDVLLARGYIDPDRLAAAGASFGGYMMAWLNGHTDRFKAMICHAGVYDMNAMLAMDVPGPWRYSLQSELWGSEQARLDSQSPARYAKHFKTPTLILHGEKDYRVPLTQGLAYYNALRLRGVPSRLVYFPDENHWILSAQNSRLWHREFFAWLERYIGTGPSK